MRHGRDTGPILGTVGPSRHVKSNRTCTESPPCIVAESESIEESPFPWAYVQVQEGSLVLGRWGGGPPVLNATGPHWYLQDVHRQPSVQMAEKMPFIPTC